MDNRLNETRKKISDLRAEMISVENQVRLLIAHDMECNDVSLRLIELRKSLIPLIRQRDALGGAETCPSIAERLAVKRRGPGVPVQRPARQA